MTIRTTHVGSLPRTPELIEANRARREGSLGEADFTSLLQDQVDGVVKRQAEIGLDIVNDGEYGHAMIDTVDYGAWWTYSFSRFGGLSFEDVQRFDVRPPPAAMAACPSRRLLSAATGSVSRTRTRIRIRVFTLRTATRSHSRRSRVS